MYHVSEAYKEFIQKPTRTTRIDGGIRLKDGTLIELTPEQIIADSVTIDNRCVNGSDFELGAVYSGQLKIKLQLQTTISRYELYDSEIWLNFQLKISDTTALYEVVPLGHFIISEAILKGKVIDITAYDNMTKFGKDITQGKTGTPYELLKFASEKCEVELAESQGEIDAMSPAPDGGTPYVLKLKETSSSIQTYRDLIAEVSKILAGFATIDRDGKLSIRRFATVLSGDESKTHTVEIGGRTRVSTEVADYKVIYRGVSLIVDDFAYTYPRDISSINGLVYEINSELCDIGQGPDRYQIAWSIYYNMGNIDYTPSKVEYFGDPALELGDYIDFVGGINYDYGDTYSFLMSSTWKYRGNHTLESFGENPKLAKAKSKNDKNAISASKNTENKSLKTLKLVTSESMNIGATETQIMRCEFHATGKNVIQYTGQALLNVSNPGTFTVIYELNGERFTFRPSQMAHDNGSYIINLFYPITEQIVEARNIWCVYLLSSDGGIATIADESVYATITATDIITGTNKFSGNVDINESFKMLKLHSLNITGMIAEPTVELMEDKCRIFTDTMNQYSTNNGIIIGNITDIVSLESPTITSETLENKAMRYIRLFSGGFVLPDGTLGGSNVLIEFEAQSVEGTNAALNANIILPYPAVTSTYAKRIVDGKKGTSSSYYCTLPADCNSFIVDLETIRTITEFKLTRYYPDNRTYTGLIIQTSTDRVNWETVWDYNVEGDYMETADGKILKLKQYTVL